MRIIMFGGRVESLPPPRRAPPNSCAFIMVRRHLPTRRVRLSGVVRLPGELRDFLQLEGPQSLLIRGAPGTGKTTLSLALLEAFRGERILITSRVPGRELHREFAGLGTTGPRAIQLIDTSEMDESVRDAARVMRHARDMLLAPLDPGERAESHFLW